MGKVLIGNNKWFIDDGLVKFKNGGFSWSENIGKAIEFQYFDYHGYYTIKEKVPVDNNWYEYGYIIYLNDDVKDEYIVNRQTLRNLYFSNILNIRKETEYKHGNKHSRTSKRTYSYLYNIGDIVNNQFLVLEREHKKLSPSGSKTKVYKCECLNDGYVFEVTERNLKQKKKCRACTGKAVIKGVNDIATKRPEMVRFLKNKDDAYRYAGRAQTILDFKCDICGKEFETSPYRFSYNFPCGCYSSDSYPNRLIREVFEYLKIPYIKELRKKHFSWCGNYRYDLYFETKDGRYAIEMDGHWHRDEQLEIDKIKDELALSNGVCVIRIDCDYHNTDDRLYYIKDSLLKSDLATIINLCNVDWDVISKNLSDDNITKKICDMRNKGSSYKDIMNFLDICKATVDLHIRIGKNNGLLNEWASSNFYKKEVFEITNLKNKKIQYCVGVHKFYENAESYIGRKLSYSYFKKHSIDNYLKLNGYGIRKISYYDYLVRTAQM